MHLLHASHRKLAEQFCVGRGILRVNKLHTNIKLVGEHCSTYSTSKSHYRCRVGVRLPLWSVETDISTLATGNIAE